jgi:hypothetical protein
VQVRPTQTNGSCLPLVSRLDPFLLDQPRPVAQNSVAGFLLRVGRRGCDRHWSIKLNRAQAYGNLADGICPGRAIDLGPVDANEHVAGDGLILPDDRATAPVPSAGGAL